MTSPEIKKLIHFLQNNGRSVISGQTKFSVNPQILKEINEIVHTIKQDIYMSSLSTTSLINKYSSNNDLMFLYDFVKKMPKLKIAEMSSSQDFSVDVSDFTNLKYLELYKFNIKRLKGIQFLRDSLEMVVCYRCLEKIGDFLLRSDPESNVSSIWSKLQHIVLSYNNITTIDQSFIYTPWLQYLDISFNHLTDLRPLTCLSNLTHLNISYNNLSGVPEIAMTKLEVFLLSHNYITDISGLSKMENLKEIDLSYNCITHHVNLLPLADLPYVISLNLFHNPITFHPHHRGLTCGYLHENVANDYFLLDGKSLCSSEKEYIRYTLPSRNSRIFNEQRNCSSGTVVKKKRSKRTRDVFIAEQNIDDDSINHNVRTSTPKKKGIEEEEDDEDYIVMKRNIEERIKQNREFWLVKHPSSLRFEENQTSENTDDTLVGSLDTTLENESTENIHSISVNYESQNKEEIEKEKVNEQVSKFEEIGEEEKKKEEEEEEEEDDDDENDEDDECEGDENDKSKDISKQPLWLVQRVDDNSKKDLFLILSDGIIKEIDVITTKVIARWSLDCVEKCLKTSEDPLTIMITFEVIRKSDRIRKYIMEFSDAQKLIHCVQQELEKRPMVSFDQVICRCMKCNSIFYKEKQRGLAPTPADQEKHICPFCSCRHVIEEDHSVVPCKGSADNDDTSNAQNNSQVTQSPSLSSIGSAASLDQSSETVNGNDESQACCQESDIEIISNPSQSSIEVLEVHNSRSQDSSITVLPKFVEKISSENPMSLVNAAVNQILTESSSSGSMTDSICTSYEATQHNTRGPHRISQSTVDEVLMEESSNETSPQQRRSEEKTILENGINKSKNDDTVISLSNYATVIEAFKEKCQLTSSPRKFLSEFNDLDALYEYSYTNFTNIDHRIKYYIWDQLVPNSVEISAFLRLDKIIKAGTPGNFPGLLVLTEKMLYFAKIVKEEKNDPLNWLQEYDKFGNEKIKIIQPILWKQGFCIEVEDRPGYNTLKYLCFLYDEKRTDDFLSFVKDLGSVHVKKSEDFSNDCDLKNLIQIDQNIKNFTLTDLITVNKNKDCKRHNFMGFVVTNSDVMILKGEAEWLIPNSTAKPAIVLTESIGNIMKMMKKENSVVLQFMDEIEQTEQSWEIKIVTKESRRKIIEAIKEPWEDLFSVQLEVPYAAN